MAIKLKYSSSSLSTIPASRVVSGKYLNIEEGALKFAAGAWMTSESIGSLGCTAKVPSSRDISNAINAQGVVVVRDILVEYEGGDSSTLFPIGDIVVEYRPNAGRVTTRKGSGGKSTFNSGYLVTYASVGIPEAVFSSIVDKFRSGCEGSSIELEKATRHDGYVWMPVKLPTDDPILAYVVDSEGDEVEVGKLLDLIAESKSSMKGYGTITLRLKQSRSRTAPSSNKFSLAGTLSAIQITDVTSLSSPPLYNKAKGMLVDVRMSQGLSELLA